MIHDIIRINKEGVISNLTILMSYDESGRPFMITYANVSYYYLLNAQGDVVGIMNVSGDIMVEYTYDAWGNVLSITGPMADTMGQHNQLRYRGYVYDPETGLYYLNSRFYNPETGRFINADVLVATGQGMLGNNMFAYCGNNPISRKDSCGTSWLAALVGAVINVVTTYIAAKATNQDYTWVDAGVAAVAGAVNAIPVVGPLLSGTVSGIYTGISAAQNGASVGGAVLAGGASAVFTAASIGNLAKLGQDTLAIVATGAADLVFGTGYNSMSAAIYKAVTTEKQSTVVGSLAGACTGGSFRPMGNSQKQQPVFYAVGALYDAHCYIAIQ